MYHQKNPQMVNISDLYKNVSSLLQYITSFYYQKVVIVVDQKPEQVGFKFFKKIYFPIRDGNINKDNKHYI